MSLKNRKRSHTASVIVLSSVLRIPPVQAHKHTIHQNYSQRDTNQLARALCAQFSLFIYLLRPSSHYTAVIKIAPSPVNFNMVFMPLPQQLLLPLKTNSVQKNFARPLPLLLRFYITLLYYQALNLGSYLIAEEAFK